MAEEITATLVVRFGDEAVTSITANGLIVMQIDDRPAGLNNGKTSQFFAGEFIGFLVHRTSNVQTPTIFSSVGKPRRQGSDKREIVQIITFANSDTASLQFPASGGIAINWLGSSGGPVTLENQKTLKLNAKKTVVLEVTYRTNFDEWLLEDTPANIQGSATYTIVITAVGTVLP